MDKITFTNLLKEIGDGLRQNKAQIDKTLNEEYCKGLPVAFSKIENIVNDFQKIESFKSEGKKIAICYDGRPEITLTYIFLM